MSEIKNDGLDQCGTALGLNGIGGERVNAMHGCFYLYLFMKQKYEILVC